MRKKEKERDSERMHFEIFRGEKTSINVKYKSFPCPKNTRQFGGEVRAIPQEYKV